jgi:diguanylate cyclase (GGDEF)-like protein/PAS domain S-box-containing protein
MSGPFGARRFFRRSSFVVIILAPIVILWAFLRSNASVDAFDNLRTRLLDFHSSAISLRALETELAVKDDIGNADVERLQETRLAFLRLGVGLRDDGHSLDVLSEIPPAYQDYAAAVDRLIVAIAANLDRRKPAQESSERFAELHRAVTEAQHTISTEAAATYRRSQRETIVVAGSASVGSAMLLLVLFAQMFRERSREAVRAATVRTEERFRALTEHSADIVWTLDGGGDVSYASPSATRLLGRTPQGQQPLVTLAHDDDRELLWKFVLRLTDDPGSLHTVECRFVTPGGECVDLELVGRNLLAHPDVEGLVLNARDISERKRSAEQLRRDALHDRLTDLPNRALLLERIRTAMSAGDGRGLTFAIAYLDLDGFKSVNDVYGHAVGDELLCLVAERLGGVLRLHERIRAAGTGGSLRPAVDTLSRLGGDEFVALLNEIDDPNQAVRMAVRIQEAVSAPFQIEGREVRVAASVGISLGPQHYRRAEELLRDADIAMYRAKTSGQTPQLFDQTMHNAMSARLTLENELRAALERDEFVLFYQPILAAGTRELRGFETLVRWNHPSRGLLAAAEFLEAAEGARLILPLGRWVLREACRQVARWRERFPLLPHGVLSVNLSALETMQPDMLDYLRSALADSGVPGEYIRIELTESAAMRDPEAAVALCRALRAERVKVGVDDFGTGYCSLAYLRHLDIDFLKVDRSLVQDAAVSSRSFSILDATVNIAKSLNLDIVFEGIETAEHEHMMGRYEGALLQGYLLAKPLPAADTLAWLSSGGNPRAARERNSVGASRNETVVPLP